MNAPQLSKEIFNLDVPILGICWGMQFMNYSHGGEVKKLDKREDGVFEIDIQTSKLFKNLGTAKQFRNFHNFAILSNHNFILPSKRQEGKCALDSWRFNNKSF